MPKKIIDYSFIFFKRSLAEVYAELGDPQIANIYKRNFIQLGINDTTRQVTNSDYNLNFGSDYKVDLVDCSGKFLLDITANCTLYQFTHSVTGFENIYFQIKNIGQAFNIPVHLKITHWSGIAALSKLIAFSNPFHISADTSETTEVQYWDYRVVDGVDYATTGARNRIRLRGIYTKPTRATELQTYTQVSAESQQGRVIHNRATKVLNYNWLVEYYDNHGMEAFESMVGSGVIYVNDVRATTIVPGTEEVPGTANFYKGSWVMNLDRAEIAPDDNQIGNPFRLIQAGLQPFGNVTLAEVSAMSLKGFFNKDITLGTGVLTVYNKTTLAVVATFTQSDITLVGGNGFEILAFIALIVANDEYYINFTSGLFRSPINETYEVLNDTEWFFKVTDEADYDDTDYKSDDYFT